MNLWSVTYLQGFTNSLYFHKVHGQLIKLTLETSCQCHFTQAAFDYKINIMKLQI